MESVKKEEREVKVTESEARERAESNLEQIDCQRGKIRFNKAIFKVTGGIGFVATGVGIAGIILSAPVLAPAFAIGFGSAAAGYSIYAHHQETLLSDEMDEKEQKNLDVLDELDARVATKRR